MLNPRCNALLDQLTENESRLVFQNLRLVSLTEGQQLFAPGDLIDQVYFPVTALIAIAKTLMEGVSIDMAFVGKEGGIGFRGMISRCPNRVYVTCSGLAYQISLQQLQKIQDVQCSPGAANQGFGSRAWLTQMYMQATKHVFDSIATETACAHFHPTRDRVARWLLHHYARCQSLRIEATHQKIAGSLGVRRESVTHALLQLQGVRCMRNHIQIIDFTLLESQACECYRAQFDSLSDQLRLPFQPGA